jgi:hypothetical protein
MDEVQLNRATISDGLLRSIHIYLDPHATLCDVLGVYGEPYAMGSGTAGGHVPLIRVYLYYPARGLEIIVKLDFEDLELRPQTAVTEVTYHEPLALQAFLEEAYHTGTESFPCDWHGYGPVEVGQCRDNQP